MLGWGASAYLAAGPGDLPAPTETADAARRRAAEILSRPELRPPPRTLLQRLFELIGDILGRVLGAGGGNVVVAWAIVVVVGLLAAGLAWLAVRALQRDPVAGGGVGVAEDVGRPAAAWRAEARHHEENGAWRDALRCHWRALVADLASRGLVEEVPGRTTGDYRLSVDRSVPGGARAFSDATGLFELAWYGAEEVGEADVSEERRLGELVLAEARR